jgi:hypothetical protein
MTDSSEPSGRAMELFQQVYELQPEERLGGLSEACGDDRTLLAEVEDLLYHHDHPLRARPALLSKRCHGGLHTRAASRASGCIAAAAHPSGAIGDSRCVSHGSP